MSEFAAKYHTKIYHPGLIQEARSLPYTLERPVPQNWMGLKFKHFTLAKAFILTPITCPNAASSY